MDWKRTAHIGGILLLSIVLLSKWNTFSKEQQALDNGLDEESVTLAAEVPTNTPAAAPAPATTASTTISTTAENSSTLPSAPQGESELPVAPAVQNPQQVVAAAATPSASVDQLVRVSTDTLELLIDRLGGDIVKVVLPQHKTQLGGDIGFTLLDRTVTTTYIAQSGLVGANGTDTAEGRPLFDAAQDQYQLAEGEDSLVVDLTTEEDGIAITKRFSFQREQYLITVTYIINNQTEQTWKANLYGQIKRDSHQPPAAADSGFGVNPYVGGATTTEDEKYKKISFSDMTDKREEFSIEGGWVAMIQHYFTSAWIPDQDATNNFFLRKLGNQEMYLLGFIAPETRVEAGATAEIDTRFYVGPKDIDKLESYAENLDLTIDFGFLWWLAKPLFHLLDFINSYVGNWGWSIIVLTIIIKAIFFYPSAISYRSMAKMRKVSPKMQEIKERFGDDRQKMSQEMMKLYKKEKVNPMGGCLPILIQMPVFIALYWVLMESVELRHAPFALWIQDLTVMDPYFIFPLLMGLTMFIQQKLNPTPPDPMQAKIMQWMPVVFTFMFLWFPAGLVIYWVTNNTLSIMQQYVITRAIEAGDS